MTWKFFIKHLLSTILAVVVGIISAIITRNASVIELSRERLDNVYHPLFLAIEPFLYKENLTIEKIKPFIDKYNELEKDYSLLINPSLRQHMKYLSKGQCTFVTDKYDNNGWYSICDLVSKDYDKLCKKAHMPIRNIAYRVTYRQYREKYKLYRGLLYLYLPHIVGIVVLFIFLLLLSFQ